MRISTRQTYDSMVNNLTNGMEKLVKTQEKLSSGREVNKPSDDPVGATQALNYKDMVSGMEQFERNIEYASSYLNEADAVLSGVNDTLGRIKEIAVNQATGTADSVSRANAAVEVGGLLEQLIGIGNSKLGDRYLFAGFTDDTAAFSINGTPPPAVNYDGDSNEAEIQVGFNTKMAYTLTGDDIFTGPGTDIYQTISDLKTALEGDDTAGIQSSIDGLDAGVNQINDAMSKIGARLNRLSVESDNISSFKLETQKLVSDIEDADMMKIISDLAQQKISFEALQMSTSKIVSLNIFNYI